MDNRKALSIKQPWASLIAHGIKDIENRTWKTNFRGRIYIHASAKQLGSFSANLTKDQLKVVDEKLPKIKMGHKFYFPDRPVSAIIGEVEIIDCVINHSSIWAEVSDIREKPIYNWVLANAVLYKKPIPCKGKLSFWEPDIFLQECIGCEDHFNFEEMKQDDSSENYCPECWEHFKPIFKAEYDEMVKNGEIDILEENGFSFETGV